MFGDIFQVLKTNVLQLPAYETLRSWGADPHLKAMSGELPIKLAPQPSLVKGIEAFEKLPEVEVAQALPPMLTLVETEAQRPDATP
jgi:hypothetical protein